MRSEDYKILQEAFVSHLNGTTKGDVVLTLLHVPLIVLVSVLLQRRNQVVGHTWKWAVMDYGLLVVPMLLIVTLCAHVRYWTFGGLVMLLLVLMRGHTAPKSAELSALGSRVEKSTPQIDVLCLTGFKGSNVLMTCICILAVDFEVFPRDMAKTEAMGVSLMDCGVGAFVISSALTSAHARSGGSTSSRGSMTRSRLVVLLLGIGRLLATRMLQYQQHVSEYGEHWNFFVSLFCLWTLADIVHWLLPWRRLVAVVSCSLLLAYQLALSHWQWAEYLLSDDRIGWMAANKEGISSLCGLLPLFLISEQLSHWLFFAESSTSTLTGLKLLNDSLTRKLSFLTVMFFAQAVLFTIWWQEPSRRLCNASYCLFVMALVFCTLLCFQLIIVLFHIMSIELSLLQLMSRHSLLVFLVANLLTGAVNMGMQTLFASQTQAMSVLLLYVLSVQATACVATRANQLVTSLISHS